ncbi:hypothetical protein UH35_24065 [Escherichia coli]|nr:hypothetical protein UH35_24065 [Escherichia coli]
MYDTGIRGGNDGEWREAQLPVPFPQAPACQGFVRGLTGASERLPSCLLVVSVLPDKLAAKENCVLAAHVITDFVDHLFRSEGRLAILTAAGINHRLVLSQDFAGFRGKFHTFSPCPAGFPAGH